jgi:putative transposase
MTDRRGVPVAVCIAAANRQDFHLLEQTVDAIVLRARNGCPRRPRHLCLDKGYDYPLCDRVLRKRRIKAHIARRGQPKRKRPRGAKARRWVVERTNSWHNRFRGLLVRWERKSENYLALCQLASALIAYQQAVR